MFLKLPILKMKPEGDGTNGSGAPQTPPATPAQTSSTKETGSATDDYGYPVGTAAPSSSSTSPAKPSTEEKKPEEKKPEEKKGNEPEVKVPGYDDPPATEEKKPEEKKPEEKPPVELGYKIEVADLHADEIKIVEELAVAHKLTKEQAQAVAEMRKLDIQALAKVEADKLEDKKTQATKLRSDWKNELQNDKSFGGTNFATSMKQAGTVLDKFFPETKKMLDEKKGMLPPSTMRDLQALHKTLFATEPLVEGDQVADKKSGNSWDSFYS